MEVRQQRILYIDTQRCMGCRACETVCKLAILNQDRSSRP